MVHTSSAELQQPASRTDAYRALHLLPTAPKELVAQVYQRLAHRLEAAADPRLRSQLHELSAAYACAIASRAQAEPEAPNHGDEPRENGPLQERHPWQVLHVEQDAPPEVVDLAYLFWRRDYPALEPEPVAIDGVPQDSDGPASYASADERMAALAATRVLAAPNGSGDGSLRAPTSRTEAEPTGGQAVAEATSYLIAEAGPRQGSRFAIGWRPFRIGVDPTCDLVLRSNGSRGRSEARIWPQADRFLLHALDGASPAVLLNGERASWAVLEHGDTLQAGDELFRFEQA